MKFAAKEPPSSDRCMIDENSQDFAKFCENPSDHDAFERAIEPHRGFLLRYLAQQLDNSADVDDVFQDICLQLVKGHHHYDKTKKFGAWLSTIASRTVVDFYREKFGRFHNKKPLECLHDQYVSSDPGPVAECITKETGYKLRQAIDSLPAIFKQAVHLAYFMELPQQLAADGLNIPLSTFHSRLRHAILKLREQNL